jgi:acetyltransferase-like isoleucine patch superfamily enzyme
LGAYVIVLAELTKERRILLPDDREPPLFARLKRYWLASKARRRFGRRVAVFGDFTVIQPRNVRIGSNCAINHGVFIIGKCGIDIGDEVVLSARVMLIDATLDPATFGEPSDRKYVDDPIRIERGAWIGAGAIILPGVTIGERSVVGAGSVVTHDVPPLSVVAGNPARLIRKIDA